MRWFPAMFCHTGSSSLVFFFCFVLFCFVVVAFFLRDVKFSRIVIYSVHRLWRTALWLNQNCCLVCHANFISCRVSFVLRCFYKSTLVVCAVARTVSKFVQVGFDLHWSFGFIEISPLTPSTRSKIQKKNIFRFHTLASKVHFRSFEGQSFYWSITTANDSIKC